MLFMRNSKYKALLAIVFGVLLIVGLVALYWWQRGDALLVLPTVGEQQTDTSPQDTAEGTEQAVEQPASDVFAEEDTPYVAVGTYTEGDATVEKSVRIFNTAGEEAHRIDIPHSTSTRAGPPIIIDWSSNRQYLTFAQEDGGDNQVYIYNFAESSLTEAPSEVQTSTYVSGAEINFSPNGQYFTAVRDTQVWVGTRPDDEWETQPLLTIMQAHGYATSSATLVSRYSTMQWQPNKPAQMLAVTSEDPADGENNYDLRFWLVDLSNGVNNPTITRLADVHETYQEQFSSDEHFRIDGFQWSNDGSELVMHWWGPQVAQKEMLLSLSNNQFTIQNAHLKQTITDALDDNLAPVYRSFAVNSKANTVYTHTYLEESAPEDATTPADWWAYDIASSSIRHFYDFTGDTNNEYRLSPNGEYLALRQAGSPEQIGSIVIVNSDGEEVLSDTLVGYGGIRGSVDPEESSAWSANGRYLAYMSGPHRYTDSGDLIQNRALTGEEITVYDTEEDATTVIRVPDTISMFGRQRVSFLIR